MPDVRELLQIAALDAAPVDLDAVWARSRVLVRRRRLAVGAGAAAAVVAAAIPLALVRPGASRSHLFPVDTVSPRPSAGTGAPHAPGGPAASPVVETVPANNGPSATAATRPAGRAPASPPVTAPALPPTRQPTDPAYAAAPSCGVDTTGLLPGETRTCRFTATQAGGWVFRTSGGAGMDGVRFAVRVQRGDQVIYNPDDTGASCANSGIAPGDRVEVTITQEARGYSSASLSAGGGYRCGVRP